ncbi:RHS repeat-associated core domain-containing protein [Candidatus Protochlamydia phocaeensis]|uniref:RHS repeat-associated core domain-containing protein n=1 Tax=Candidatus Protochlamydia phocaeensis TaxID=1414722 RepID=UPI0008381832|nr:RHS repeat-associated core domain-containing protein [Candidatus Protochlamydia phocaeensis]
MFYKIIRFVLCSACLFISFINADSSVVVPTPFVNSVNVITGKLDNVSPSGIICEYYKAGKNQVGERSVQLGQGDFRIGRIKSQKEANSQEAFYFFYAPQATEVIDARQRKTVYRYTKSNLIQAIEHHERQPNGTYALYRSEKIFWKPASPHSLLSSRVLEDGQGHAILCYAFIYNDQGQVVKEMLAGNLSGTCSSPLLIQEDGLPALNGIETYSTVYRYAANDPTLITSQREDNGMATTYHYHPLTKQCIAKLRGNTKRLLSRTFYLYDDQGLLSRTVVDDGQGQTIDDLTGVTNRQIMHIQACQKGLAYGQPLLTENRYLDLQTGQEVLLERTAYTYSPQGSLVQQDFYDANEALRYYVHMNYDEEGRLLATVDSRGEVALAPEEPSQNRFDAFNQCLASIDAYGNETEYTYDHFGRLIETRFPYVLDENDTPIRPILRQEYNICDQVVRMQDAQGRSTATSYNARGKPIEVIYADGSRETYHYFLDGELKEKTASNGLHSIWERDDLGRTIRMQELSSTGRLLRELLYSYEGSQLSTVTDGRSFTIHLTYDGAGRKIGSLYETNEGTKRLEWVYDACGQKIQTREWFGPGEEDFICKKEEKDGWQETKAISLEDSQGNVQRSLDHKGPTVENAFFSQELTVCNQLGQFVKCEEIVDSRGIKELRTYDALQRLESCIKLSPLGEKISEKQIRYDASGQKVLERHMAIYQGQPLRTYIIKWAYDDLNRLTAIHEAFGSPDQKTTRYMYNEKGQITGIIKPDGTALTYTYGSNDLVSSFSASDGSFAYQYSYDAFQRLIQIDELTQGLQQTRRYNAFNELMEETLAPSIRIANQYDRSGRRTRLTLPDQSHIAYRYAGLFLETIEREGMDFSYRHSYSYDLSGRMSESRLIDQAGILSYGYDEQGRLLSIRSPSWTETIDCLDSNGRILSLSIQDPEGTTHYAYTYGDDNQLTEEEGPFSQHYAYDSLYNRLAEGDQEWTVDTLNQLVQTPHLHLSYDLNGNLIEKQDEKGKTAYQYDALNRLVRVTKDDSAIQYLYDAFDRRIEQKLYCKDAKNSVWKLVKTDYFIHDGQKEIGKMNDSFDLTELRVLGVGKGAELSAAIALEIEGKVFAPIHDHQGSVRCLLEAETGQVAEFYRYSAFGQEQVFDKHAQIQEGSLIGNPWRFSSKRIDEETGLILFGKRYYAPETGRWISPDPLFFYDTPNLYAFVRNDSVNCYDPYGLFSISDIWDTTVSYFFECFRYLQTSAHIFKVRLTSELKLPELIATAFERIGKTLFGEATYLLMGHSYEKTEVGVYGQKEINDKVRVTFINGILTTREGMLENLNLISRSHGGVKVHYIFRPTEGWTWDISRAMLIKMAFYLGFRSIHAHLLAAQWRSLIQEMGGVDGGGTIIHYAHSLGGSETDRARALLTPEEQRLIRVITFGSATLIRNEGFQKVTNMVCVNDGVSSVFLEPLGHIRNFLDPNSNVQFHGSFFAFPCWPADHLLGGPTYAPILEGLGEQFLKEFSRL